ncbi:MAG: TIR domain-containing protein, partial [Bacteroidota bacterium]
LLAKNKTKTLLKELATLAKQNGQGDSGNDLVLLTARFNRNKTSKMQGIITDAAHNIELNRINYALHDYIENLQMDDTSSSAQMQGGTTDKRSVFISYSHSDKFTATRVREALEAADLEVKIDSASMHAGGDIKTFIEQSVRDTAVTLSIVSKNSLLSSWVAMESVKSFAAQELMDKRFIAAYIDDSFFEYSFADEALDRIDAHISNLQELIKGRLAKNRNINDLQEDLDRHSDLKHNFPKIISRLKASLSIDISEGNFELGMTSIIKSIKS